MKKFFLMLSAAALAVLPLISSCNKSEQPSKEIEMEPAATASVAKLVTFDASNETLPIIVSEGQTYEMNSIEFTEGSRYILRITPILIDGTVSAAATKASSIRVVSGKYSMTAGKYVCTGVFKGSISISNGTAEVAPEGGVKQTVKVTVKDTQNNTVEGTNASRTWKVSSSFVKISGSGVTVEAGFNGCDFHEIATLADKEGVKIDPDKLAGYKIDEVILTGEGTLTISFTGAEAFYGSYKLNGSNISYTLSSGGNDLMGQSASGTLTFPANHQASLVLNTTVKNYSGSIELNLTEVNN